MAICRYWSAMPVFNPYRVAHPSQCPRRRDRASIRNRSGKEKRMSTEKRVNIGMIGAGWWPNTMHMPALAACEQANVVAVCDLIPERAEALAKKYHIPYTFTDYRELLASGLCEAVVVAITNDAHYPVTMDALNRGLHAICEKPLALNYTEASEMAVTAQKK